MTPGQIKLIQESFAKVAPISEDAAALFHGRLFEIAPEVLAPPDCGGENGLAYSSAPCHSSQQCSGSQKHFSIRQHKPLGVRSGQSSDFPGASIDL
jgi:hypothetical protein